jgi:hypothetical protein
LSPTVLAVDGGFRKLAGEHGHGGAEAGEVLVLPCGGEAMERGAPIGGQQRRDRPQQHPFLDPAPREGIQRQSAADDLVVLEVPLPPLLLAAASRRGGPIWLRSRMTGLPIQARISISRPT